MTLPSSVFDLPKLFMVPDTLEWDAEDEGYAVLMNENEDGYLTVCDQDSLIVFAKANGMTLDQAADFILRHSVVH